MCNEIRNHFIKNLSECNIILHTLHLNYKIQLIILA